MCASVDRASAAVVAGCRRGQRWALIIVRLEFYLCGRDSTRTPFRRLGGKQRAANGPTT